MANNGQHVVPRNGKWSVRKSGASKATATYRTKQEAVQRATEIAKNQNSELYVHGRDGKIQSRNSYGNDPYPPKG